MNIKLITITIATLSLMACNGVKNTNIETSASPNDIVEENISKEVSIIENTKWIISTLEGKDMSDREKNGQIIYFILNPEDNRIHGNSGCNTFFGNYTLTANQSISFSTLASTRMMCSDAKINESQIVNIFEKASSFIITDGELIINNDTKNTLATFKKESINEPIIEKYWKLKQLDGKEISMAENQEREIFFTLKTNDKKITGFAGCNSLSGEYILEEGNRIKFSKIAVTLMICPDDAFNESEFLNVFELADNYTINDDILSLNVGRTPLAVFEAVYFD